MINLISKLFVYMSDVKYWKVKWHLKVKMLLELIAKHAIVTLQSLQRRGLTGPNFCVLCRSTNKSTKHLFLRILFAQKIWTSCTRFLGVSIDM